MRRKFAIPVRNRISGHFDIEGNAVDIFQAACGQDSEGIVAKLASGRYDPDATTWVKIKNRRYSQAEGRADFFHPHTGESLR